MGARWAVGVPAPRSRSAVVDRARRARRAWTPDAVVYEVAGPLAGPSSACAVSCPPTHARSPAWTTRSASCAARVRCGALIRVLSFGVTGAASVREIDRVNVYPRRCRDSSSPLSLTVAPTLLVDASRSHLLVEPRRSSRRRARYASPVRPSWPGDPRCPDGRLAARIRVPLEQNVCYGTPPPSTTERGGATPCRAFPREPLRSL